MSPIKDKLNSSLHKLGDKMKRARSAEVIETNDDTQKSRHRNHPSNDVPATPLDMLASLATKSKRAKASGLKHSIEQAGSMANPTDLTDSSMASSPNFTNYHGSTVSATESRPTSMEDECFEAQGQPKEDGGQVENDAALAWALHLDMNRDPTDEGSSDSQNRRGTDVSLQLYLESLRRKSCPKCTTQVSLDAEMTVTRTKTMLRKEGVLHPYVQCKKCKYWLCMGCDVANSTRKLPTRNVVSEKGFKIIWCCEQSRLFLVWSLTCGPDCAISQRAPDSPASPSVQSLRNRYGLRSRTKALKSEPETSTTQDTPATKGAGPIAKPILTAAGHFVPEALAQGLVPKGTGYGGAHNFALALGGGPPPAHLNKGKKQREGRSLPANARERREQEAREYLTLYLPALKNLLPSLAGDQSASSALPSSAGIVIAEMLCRSPLLPKASELLRNDAIDEISKEEILYSRLLEFIDCLGSHHCTFPLLVEDLVLYRPEEQLLAVSVDPSHLSRDTLPAAETTQPLFALMENLAKQCRHFVSATSTHIAIFATGEQSMVNLSKRVVKVYDTLEANRQGSLAEAVVRGRSDGSIYTPLRLPSKTVEGEDEARKSLEKWCRENKFDELPHEAILAGHYFTALHEKTANDPPSLGRMKKLITQVSSLRTALPDGIYVRHSSARLDLMKILIVGPAGTPYENGLFEFDLICPADFPVQHPPSMQFRTTGGGTIRFNPNLYADGRVCLSLLGTWAGPKWTDESTILQILVSVQAMIFTDNPWYNEPGREMTASPQHQIEADKYNRDIQGWTLRHAMLFWLNDRLAPPPSVSSTLADEDSTRLEFNHHGVYTPNSDSMTTFPTSPGDNSDPNLLVNNNKKKPSESQGQKSAQHPVPVGTVLAHAFNQPNLPDNFPGGETSLFSGKGVTGAEAAVDGSGPSVADPQAILEDARTRVINMEKGKGVVDDPVWGDVIKAHFKLKGRDILETAKKWRGGHKGKAPQDLLVRDLEATLKRHGFISDDK